MRLKTAAYSEVLDHPGDKDWHLISLACDEKGFWGLGTEWGRVTTVCLADDDAPDAKAIARIAHAVLLAFEYKPKGLLIQCGMGISRSVGVARAVAAFFNIPYTHSHPGNVAIKQALLSTFEG